MNTCRVLFRVVHVAAVSALLVASGTIFSAEPPTSSTSAPTKQMREQMAVVHEQMASCLRSDKPIAECRAGMQQRCQEMMGQQGCQAMGMGNMDMMNGMKRKP